MLFLATSELVGKLMPVDENYAIGFYEHPRLVDLSNGSVVHRWSHLNSGKEESSIQSHSGPSPPLALDSARRRFAVAGDDSITVVEFDPDGYDVPHGPADQMHAPT